LLIIPLSIYSYTKTNQSSFDTRTAINPYLVESYKYYDGILGNNVPIATIMNYTISPDGDDFWDYAFENWLYLGYMGSATDSQYVGRMYADIENLESENGWRKYKVTNKANKIDGKINGSNVMEVGCQTQAEDPFAPTLQFMMFKDSDNKVNDRFNSAENTSIELYAGDFYLNTNLSEYTGQEDFERFDWYECNKPADVKVEWAPYQTDNFTSITVTEDESKYFMPGYGYFYSGSLSSVNKVSSNGWFDVRITVTDTTGNYQKQVISPAFYIAALDGVGEVTEDNVQVYVRDGAIVVSGVENPNIEVYNAAGSRVRTSGLTQGIYVVRVNGTAHKVFVK
jgi:hypothetical protein